VDRRSSICRRISIIVDRRWSALSQAHRDWPDVYADVSKHDGPMLHCRRAMIRAGRNSSSLEVATSPGRLGRSIAAGALPRGHWIAPYAAGRYNRAASKKPASERAGPT
jgi:hypothetical protein